MKIIAALFLTAGICFSTAYGAYSSQQQSDSPMQGLDRSSERSADRMLRSYDTNKDGRITRAEMNNILGARFAAATHHTRGMSVEQFLAARANEFRIANEAMFHRLDWNGDGKLSLQEYAAPQHIRFVQLDQAGQGYVFCGVGDLSRGGKTGMAAFCRENDLDMDGRVTRTELDQAISKRFSIGKTQAMSLAQFIASEEQRYQPTNLRAFRRLDEDGDGTLTIQEYAANEIAQFSRLDKNGNGIVEPSELHPRQTRMALNGRQRY